MGRGTGRKRRLKLVDGLEASDPALAAELEDLRRYSPQAYRKRLRALDRTVLIGGRGVIPLPHPGRETDPVIAESLTAESEPLKTPEEKKR